MNIAFYVPLSTKSPKSNFIVGTFFPLFGYFKEHNLYLITEENKDLPEEFNTISISPQPKNPLLKKIWLNGKLGNSLNKIKADIFICADNFCLSKTAFPQLILMPDSEKLKVSYTKNADLIVMSETEKQRLVDKRNFVANKIIIVHPSPQKEFFPIDDDKRKSIKEKYSEDKEYFLINTSFQKKQELINLLKSYSHFKKRQQSSFKLLLLIDSNTSLEKDIENYKYRNDVILIKSNDEKEKAAITAAAYAMIFPFSDDYNIIPILNAMQSGVPVIGTKNETIKEIAGDAVLYGKNEIKDIGEKMMQLYKDEILRSQLIEQGKEKVKNYTEENSAAQLWQAIMKVTN